MVALPDPEASPEPLIPAHVYQGGDRAYLASRRNVGVLHGAVNALTARRGGERRDRIMDGTTCGRLVAREVEMPGGQRAWMHGILCGKPSLVQ